MTKKKRITITLNDRCFERLQNICYDFECSYSHAIIVAIDQLSYSLIDNYYFHPGKKLADKEYGK